MEFNKAGIGDEMPRMISSEGEARLMLERAPNGGWVVSSAPENIGMMSKVFGAYSSTEDMLEALRKALG